MINREYLGCLSHLFDGYFIFGEVWDLSADAGISASPAFPVFPLLGHGHIVLVNILLKIRVQLLS